MALVKYSPDAPARPNRDIGPSNQDLHALQLPVPGFTQGAGASGRAEAPDSIAEGSAAAPPVDLVYHGGARRTDTRSVLIVGLILSAVAAWWVAEILFGLVRDWSR